MFLTELIRYYYFFTTLNSFHLVKRMSLPGEIYFYFLAECFILTLKLALRSSELSFDEKYDCFKKHPCCARVKLLLSVVKAV